MKFQEETKEILYTDGFKYRLEDTAYFKTSITGFSGCTEYITIHANGWIEIKAGYCYDGPSGPTIDTDDSLRGSLLHDALYELMRKGILSPLCRKSADKELWRILREDGMNRIRADAWYYAVRELGSDNINPNNIRKIKTAPRR